MKKIIAAAFFSAVIAAPAIAEEATAKATTAKAAPAKMAQKMHGHAMKMPAQKKSGMKDDCEQEHHGMGGHHDSMSGMKDDCEQEHHGMGGGHHEPDMMGEIDDHSMMMPHMDTLASLHLEGEQRAKIVKLFDKLKHDNWITMGLMNDETVKLRDLYEADKHDAAAIGKVYQAIFDLKRQMIEASIDTENKIDEILTQEQRAQLKSDCHDAPPMHEHHKHEHRMN